MNSFCLYLFLFCVGFRSGVSTTTPNDFSNEPCSWFDEQDAKVEAHTFLVRDYMWRMSSLKRMRWALLRGIRGPQVGRRIDNKSLANLASTYLPDPGSRFVEDISKSVSDSITASEPNRTQVWSSFRDYHKVLRGLSPAIREIVYAKISENIHKLILDFGRGLKRDEKSTKERITLIKSRKHDIVKCFEDSNSGLQKANDRFARMWVHFAVIQSRIEIIRFMVTELLPRSTIVWTANKVSADTKEMIRKDLEAMVTSRKNGYELRNLVQEGLNNMREKLGLTPGDLGLVYKEVLDEFAKFVEASANTKQAKLMEHMNTIQGMIDRYTAHLERLRSFYA